MSEELIYINPGEGLPGFPSGHGPGLYLVDFEARTIRPASITVEDMQPIPSETDAQPAEEPQIETEEQGG